MAKRANMEAIIVLKSAQWPPGGVTEVTFAKTADLHETCAGMDGLHVHPSFRAPFSHLFGPTSHPKALPERCQQNTLKK